MHTGSSSAVIRPGAGGEPIFFGLFLFQCCTRAFAPCLPGPPTMETFFTLLFFGSEGVKVSANVGYLCTTACFHSNGPQLEPGGIQKR